MEAPSRLLFVLPVVEYLQNGPWFGHSGTVFPSVGGDKKTLTAKT
jgi:hypothetical protein